MYYEMSDESSKSLQYRQNKIILSKKENTIKKIILIIL
jgi:hypothetical protein